jgi:tRNA-Thr(GGU) m(6)t(6)A37 methyltransferase TsaA
MPYRFEPIGIIHSCFKEKFGIPRQPGLAPAARATLELLPPCDREEAIRGLEAFSHLWLIFLFHATADQGWSPTVRPPRLGGNERVGVFATRSTFRPNPIGLSVVELERIEREPGKLLLHLRGADLLDGTPVLDIKPYIPYADSVPGATADRFALSPVAMPVRFTPEAEAACHREEPRLPGLRMLIEQVIAQDPRPAYQEQPERVYGVRLYDLDVRWQVQPDGSALVIAAEAART